MTTYLVRTVQGRLGDVPFDVHVLISRRHRRGKNPKCFLCTDLSSSAQTVLTWYGNRWSLEVDYCYLKRSLDLGDFRLQAYEAIERWHAVVHLVLTFLQWRLYQTWARGHSLRTLADVIRQHRSEHDQELLTTACQEAIRLEAVEQSCSVSLLRRSSLEAAPRFSHAGVGLSAAKTAHLGPGCA